MNTNQNTPVNNLEMAHHIDEMDRELRFLWQEAHEEVVESIKDRKLKQFWDLFRAYKKQKQFLLALGE